MTDIAFLGCDDMCRALACCNNAIVTAGTVSSDARVIEVGRRPGGRRMAVVAVIAAQDMVSMLAGGSRAVVAREAGADNLRMIDRECRVP